MLVGWEGVAVLVALIGFWYSDWNNATPAQGVHRQPIGDSGLC